MMHGMMDECENRTTASKTRDMEPLEDPMALYSVIH